MRDTADLSLAEHGAYMLLLLHYYATEQPLPNDNRSVFRIARAMAQDEQEAVTRVADRFFPVSETDGLRHNSRADEEITKALERIRKNQPNGKKGGRPKKTNKNQPVNTNQTPRATKTKTKHKTKNKPH